MMQFSSWIDSSHLDDVEHGCRWLNQISSRNHLPVITRLFSDYLPDRWLKIKILRIIRCHDTSSMRFPYQSIRLNDLRLYLVDGTCRRHKVLWHSNSTWPHATLSGTFPCTTKSIINDATRTWYKLFRFTSWISFMNVYSWWIIDCLSVLPYTVLLTAFVSLIPLSLIPLT